MRVIYGGKKMASKAKVSLKKWVKQLYSDLRRKWVSQMEHLCKNFTAKQWRIVFFSFILFGSIISCWLVAKPFLIKPQTRNFNRITKVVVSQSMELKTIPSSSVPNANVVKLINYLDRLENTAAGKKEYDSLLRHRPGLIDSLILLKSLYE